MKIVGRRQATEGNPPLDQALRDIETWMTNMEKFVGYAPVKGSLANANQLVAAPPTPILTVTGVSGNFSVSIEHGDGQTQGAAPLYHELQYSSTVPFEASADLSSVPVTNQSRFALYFPNTIKYFRAHSRFANGEWSPWAFSAGAIFSTGAGASSAFGFAAASLVRMFDGSTKAASAIAVGDTVLGLGGDSLTVQATYNFTLQDPSQVTATNGGPLDIGGGGEIVQADGNFKLVGDIQVGDSILVRVAGVNAGDTVTALAVPAEETLYAFQLAGSQTINVNGIWCRLRI